MSVSVPAGEKSHSHGHTIVRCENQVGILLRVGKHQRFHAKVKERFSDFHVHEIDSDGNIVKLTSLTAPIQVEKKVDNVLEVPEITKCLTEDIRKRILDLQENIAERKGNWRKEVIEINVTELEKDQRTKIHNWISDFDKLASTTVDKDGQKLIVVSGHSNKTVRRPANRAKYTHCVLYKEGLDTATVIGYIAKKLNLKPNLITYAGTKDRQAKTTQRISIPNIDAARLVEISEYSKNSKIGNYEYLTKPIFLGCLKGNHFTLLLKNVQAESDSIIEEAVLSLKNQGFINYYGLQRFGSFDVSTHDVGKALLQDNFIKAFDLILQDKDNDPEFLKKAKEAWFKRRDPQEAKRYFPHSYRSIESNLIYGLSKFYRQKMYLAAFQTIPRNTRQLYVHAVQSYLWNRMASYRIEKYGLKPIVGDLVYSNPNNSLLTDAEGEVTEGSENVERDDELGNEEETPKCEVIIVTEGNKSRYSIFDILIPLPGPEIKYPKNGVKDFYENLLRDDNLPLNCFAKLNSNAPDSPKGAYRRMMIRPKNVSYEIIPYCDGDNLDGIIESDMDKLNAQMPVTVNVKDETQSEGTAADGDVNVKNNDNADNQEKKMEIDNQERKVNAENPENKTKKCVKFELSLPASSYATMALRELLLAPEKKVGAEVTIKSETVTTNDVETPVNETTDQEKTNGNTNDNIGATKRTADQEDSSEVSEKKQKMTGNGSADIDEVKTE